MTASRKQAGDTAAAKTTDNQDNLDELATSGLADLFTLAVTAFSALGLGYFLTFEASHTLTQPRMAPWLIARASGITAYILLWFLALAGILLTLPARQKLKFLHPIVRMRFHTLLAIFTLSFTLLHIMSVILDSYANVGVKGALIPFMSGYRNIPVALGTLGFYAGCITGLSARLKIGARRKLWLSVHRFSLIAVVMIWFHALYSGTDSPELGVLYLATAATLIAAGYWRYSSNHTSGTRQAPPAQPKKGEQADATSSGATSSRGSQSIRSK